MSAAAFVGQLALASLMVPAFQQGGQVHAGWLSGPSVVPAPRADVEPEIKFPVDIVKIHETVRDLESKPMCSRLAYKTVINACGTYDSSSDQIFQDSDDAVRAFRNLFAIQMTACVMEDAQQDMPAACQPLLQPLSRDPRHGIKDCLASMVDTQNYWSSYLHNLENGRFLCDTMRSRIEKEEQLEHFRKVARAFQRMGNFAEEHSVSLKELKQLNEALDAALRTTLVDMEHENKQFKADMIRNFNEVARNMSSVGASVQSLFGPLDQIDQRLQNVDNIVASVSSLSTDIGTGVMGVMQLHEALDTLRAKMQLEAQQLLGDIHRKAYEVERSVHRANEVMVPLAGELELSMSKIQSINAAADGTQYKFEHIHQNLNGIAAHTNNTRESIEILDEHVQKMLPLAASASTVLSSFASGLSNVMNFGAQWVLGTAIMLIFLEVMGIGFWYALVSSALAGIFVATLDAMPLMWLSTLFRRTETANAVFEDELQTSRVLLVAFFACVFIALGAGLNMAYNKYASRWREYDPASPKYSATSRTYIF